LFTVIPAVLKPESSVFKRFWIPASAGMTIKPTLWTDTNELDWFKPMRPIEQIELLKLFLINQ